MVPRVVQVLSLLWIICASHAFFLGHHAAPCPTTSKFVKSKSTQSTILQAIKAERPDLDLGDLTGGRPGAIIETKEQLERKEEILQELATEERKYDAKILKEYGDVTEEEGIQYDIDDPDAIDASTLGTWNVLDLESKFDYEWDPESGVPDPNLLDPNKEYLPEMESDAEGMEKGWDPIFGSSNPMDTRTMVGTVDSYMVDEQTRDDTMLTPEFPEGDLEQEYNEDVRVFRKSLNIIESYIDPFLPSDMPVPRHVAKWHGYPERTVYPQKDYSNNRFTEPEQVTPFDEYDPHKARTLAVQYARAKNCEWLPEGVSAAVHREKRAPYERHGTLVGTLRRGECDETLVEQIQPALRVLGSVVELLSIEGEGKVFRFEYHGLMKNKFGMAAWAETLIRDCGVECTGVVFETGFRRRDPAYDGGDPWYGPY